MTKKIGNTVIIEPTAPAVYTDCRDVSELRPYGKNGAWVCFTCAMNDEDEAKRQFVLRSNRRKEVLQTRLFSMGLSLSTHKS